VIPAVPIHADLGPMNVIVDARGRVTVLDFTMAKTGPRHHDLSHLYFHLELMAARHRSRQHVFRALQSAMLGGFDPAASAGEPQFRMMLMQHGVCHVALLAERRVPVVDLAYRWFLRRRWQTCERMADGQGELRVA
jgi:aminoglycoside/choline kinase family phosphotransferase